MSKGYASKLVLVRSLTRDKMPQVSRAKCRAHRCSALTGTDIMCPTHWAMVPKTAKKSLLQNKAFSPDWQEALNQAKLHICIKEYPGPQP